MRGSLSGSVNACGCQSGGASGCPPAEILPSAFSGAHGIVSAETAVVSGQGPGCPSSLGEAATLPPVVSSRSSVRPVAGAELAGPSGSVSGGTIGRDGSAGFGIAANSAASAAFFQLSPSSSVAAASGWMACCVAASSPEASVPSAPPHTNSQDAASAASPLSPDPAAGCGETKLRNPSACIGSPAMRFAVTRSCLADFVPFPQVLLWQSDSAALQPQAQARVQQWNTPVTPICSISVLEARETTESRGL